MTVAYDPDNYIFSASRKLPDDLSVVEYTAIVTALNDIAGVACWSQEVPQSTPTLVRSQYGSDLGVLIAVPPIIAGVIYTISQAVKNLSEAAKNSAAAEREQAAIDLDAAQAEKTRAEGRKIDAETALLELAKRERVRELYHLTNSESERLRALAAIVDVGEREGRDGLGGRLDAALNGMDAPAGDADAALADLARGVTVLSSYDIDLLIQPGGQLRS